MPCRSCQYFLTSEQANQRAVLEGWGYCTAGQTPLERAQFFHESRACWLDPQRFQERRP